MDIEPTKDDWITWAKTSKEISGATIEFINKFPSSLRHTGQMEPGKTYPNPASWHRLNVALTYAGMDPDDVCGSGALPELFYPMCLGFIGQTDAVKYGDFLKEYINKFFAEDVIDQKRWSSRKQDILDLNNDKKNSLLEQIIDWTKTEGNNISLDEVDRCVELVKSCSEEMIVNFFNMVMETEDLDTIKKFHKRLGKLVTDIINESGKY